MITKHYLITHDPPVQRLRAVNKSYAPARNKSPVRVAECSPVQAPWLLGAQCGVKKSGQLESPRLFVLKKQ